MTSPAEVMVVDERGSLHRMVSAALRNHPALRVVDGPITGASAVERCAAAQPDVVVLDQDLPEVAADDLVVGIRERCPTTRVVLCTADDSAAAVDSLVRTIEHEVGVRRVMTWALDAETISAGRARDLVTATLREWECDQLVADVQLVVSELVTNAVVHAGSRCVLRLRLVPGGVRVEVTDAGDGSPQPMPVDGERVGGRGLMIVSAVSRAWGVDPAEPVGTPGKTVWAELAA